MTRKTTNSFINPLTREIGYAVTPMPTKFRHHEDEITSFSILIALLLQVVCDVSSAAAGVAGGPN